MTILFIILAGIVGMVIGAFGSALYLLQHDKGEYEELATENHILKGEICDLEKELKVLTK